MAKKEVITNKISQEITSFAKANKLRLSQVDFSILATQTYFKTKNQKEFQKYTLDIDRKFRNMDGVLQVKPMLKLGISLNQMHKILIFPKKNKSVELEYQSNFSNELKPVIALSSNSKIAVSKDSIKTSFIMLKNEINKIKAKNFIIINFFDTSMNIKLKKIISNLGKIKNLEQILLFDGIKPESSIPAKIEKIYEKGKEESRLFNVNENELILEYIKPKLGLSGINFKGKNLEPKILQSIALEPKLDVNSIKAVVSRGEKISYYTKKKGYVEFKDNFLSISNKVVINDVKMFEKNLSQAEANDVEIVVSQDDNTKDTIGEGVNLVSERVDVSGHTGKNTSIEGKYVNVEGSTHSLSSIKAKDVVVNRHKGKIYSNTAKVKNLEGGEIHSTLVEVQNALSGVISGVDVVVDNLKSKVKIYASNSITIKNLKGEDNILAINPQEVFVVMQIHKKNKEDIKDLKEKIQINKKANKTSLNAPLKAQKNELEQSILARNEESKVGTIEIHGNVNGINLIEFQINDDKASFRTNDGMYPTFYIESEEDGFTLKPVGVKSAKL